MINEKTSTLLAALVAKSTPVQVEEFGTVYVRQITVSENDGIAKIAKNKEAAPSEFGLQLIIKAVVDEQGNAMFDDENLPALRESAGTKVDNLVNAVLIANGYKKAEDAKN